MELNLSKLVTAVVCRDYTGIVLAFISRVELFDYAVDGGGDMVRAVWWLGGGGSQMGDMVSRWGGGDQTLRTPSQHNSKRFPTSFPELFVFLI